jgi:hypothetical protein
MPTAEDHLRAALAELDREVEALQLRLVESAQRREGIVALLGGHLTVERGVSGNGTGLRAAIRSVLAGTPKGLRPREVTAALEGRGVTASGTLPLGTRVTNELWRMAKGGRLRKVSGRYYLPKEERTRDSEN